MLMLISDLMNLPVHACGPGDTVSSVRNLMFRHHISRVLVLDQTRLVGIITRKDIGFSLRSRDPAWRRRPVDNELVSTLMTPDVLVVSPVSSVRDALILMVTHQISGFPVVDQGMVLGVVTKTDLMKSPIIADLDLPVQEVMRGVAVVTRDHTIDHVIDLMSVGSGPVIVSGDDGHPAGVISESDLAFAKESKDMSDKMTAGEIMRSPVVTCEESARTREVIREMVSRHISSLVITDVKGIKGIITRDDIIREVAQ